MITWTTYGTWLQGDGRGYVKDGKIFGANEKLEKINRSRQIGKAVRLNKKNREIITKAILEEAKKTGQTILASAVCSNHIHIVVDCVDETIAVIAARYKRAGSAALGAKGFVGKVWTRGYDKRYCFDSECLQKRVDYVKGHH